MHQKLKEKMTRHSKSEIKIAEMRIIIIIIVVVVVSIKIRLFSNGFKKR